MSGVTGSTSAALPFDGEVFLDARGDERTLRISWHHEITPYGTLVVSLWRNDLCVGTFRLRGPDIPVLVDVLSEGLSDFGYVGASDQPNDGGNGSASA